MVARDASPAAEVATGFSGTLPPMRPRFAVAAAVLVAALIGATQAQSARPLRTALYFPPEAVGPSRDLIYKRIASSGATFLRIMLNWKDVAPAQRPASWDPADPADPHYRWHKYDQLVISAVRHGFTPYLTVVAAPVWAQASPPATPYGNSNRPDAAEFGRFATAVARRYSGRFRDLPRVRYFQAWNEPNISIYLIPQLRDGRPVGAELYRRMLNGFAASVHTVHRDNVVIAGGLAPFRDDFSVEQDEDWGPISFMRVLLCVDEKGRPTCNTPVHFDVWAQHPYTSGGPFHHAYLPNDVSLGDLWKVRLVLDQAERLHHIVSTGPLDFWVTEFSWDTNPPDSGAVPLAIATRWVAEALHRMWANRVSLVTWLMLRDSPLDTSNYQSGLYFNGDGRNPRQDAPLARDRPKPILQAFRFPVVAYQRRGRRVYVWGRTPAGTPGRVVIEEQAAGKWLRLGVIATDSVGIFQRTLPGRGGGTSIRARLAASGELSRTFSFTAPQDFFVNPFGGRSSTEQPPKKK
jgi:hypothetical protein